MFVSHSSEDSKSKIEVLTDLVSDESRLSGSQTLPSYCVPHVSEGTRELCVGSFL